MPNYPMIETLELDIVSLLIAATTARKMRWEDIGGDSYNSTISEHSYSLGWLYWYNESGITTGRMAAVLSVHDHDVIFFGSTHRWKAVERLLSEVDTKWRDYYQRIREGCLTMLPREQPPMQCASMYEPSMLVLSSILAATRSGAMTWSADGENPSQYYSTYEGHDVRIRFVDPIDYDDKPIKNLIAELYLPRASMAFVCGTDGYLLIEEILACSVDSFRARIQNCVAALNSEIEFLKRLTS